MTTKKHKFYHLQIVFLFLFLLLGNLFAQKRITEEPRPSWVDNPLPGIFVGISHKFREETDARADALSNAKREIIESLGGIIESEFVDEIVESSGSMESSDAFTSSKIKVVSKNIIAIKPSKIFVEKFKIKDSAFKSHFEYRAFVAVPFSEAKHKKFMGELVDETCALGDNRFDESMKLANMGRIFLAIEQLKTIDKNVSPITEITGLSPLQIANLKQVNEKIIAKIEELKNGIRIEGQGEKQSAKLGKALPEPLEIFVYCLNQGEKISMPGLKVDYRIVDGKATFNPTGHTNDSGKSKCEIRKISSAGKLKIEALVTFPKGYGIENNSYIFNILSENKIIVKIEENNLATPVAISYLENKLLQNFGNSGFTIIENDLFTKMTKTELENSQPETIVEMVKETGADLVILGTISTDPGQVNKLREGFYFARARGVIKVFNIEEMTVVGNYILEDKDAGNSEENAGSKAISKVSDELVKKLFSEIGLE